MKLVLFVPFVQVAVEAFSTDPLAAIFPVVELETLVLSAVIAFPSYAVAFAFEPVVLLEGLIFTAGSAYSTHAFGVDPVVGVVAWYQSITNHAGFVTWQACPLLTLDEFVAYFVTYSFEFDLVPLVSESLVFLEMADGSLLLSVLSLEDSYLIRLFQDEGSQTADAIMLLWESILKAAGIALDGSVWAYSHVARGIFSLA